MKGFTLIEILIAVTIFVVVILIVSATVFLSSEIYKKTEEKTELMQNGRVVLDVISRELRQARKIVTNLSDSKENATFELIFQDGHIKNILERNYLISGELSVVFLPETSSDEDDYYLDSFIKILDGPEEVKNEKRKIIRYEGNQRKAYLDFPFSEHYEYDNLEYLIDTSYYYIRYFLENDKIKREIYSYYFPSTGKEYVPFNSIPPEGEAIIKEIFEEPKVIGEHFQSIKFWEDGGINVFVNIQFNERTLDLKRKVYGRNL